MEADVVLDRRLDKQSLAPFLQRSDARGLRQAAAHLALLLLCGLAVWYASRASGAAWWLVWPAMLLLGLVMTFLFAPLHETIHRTAFKTRWLNGALAWFCGALLLLPPDYFRSFHFAHHANTQDPDRDPELLGGPKPTTRAGYLWQISGLPYWIYQAKILLLHALGRTPEAFVNERMARKIVREARILLSVYGILLAGSLLLRSDALLWLWILPALLGQPFLRAYLLAEHWGCELSRDMLRNTRTTTTNALVRRLAWNMPFHVEHHAYPAVPFHALPALHPLLRARIAVLTPGYRALHRQLWKSLS